MTRILIPLQLAAVLVLGGCAFTTANLNVAYPETSATRGPLSSVGARRVEIAKFVDKRPETNKIGYKRNGFGQKTADILTTKPVPDIIRDALATEFKRNGHDIGASDRDVVLSGEISTFWFEAQINFATVEFFGTSAIVLNVVDGKTGTTLLTRSYQGHYTEKSMGGLEATWERVMNEALQRMVREVSTDNRLVQALKKDR